MKREPAFNNNLRINMKKIISLISVILIYGHIYSQFDVQYIHANPLKFSLNDFNKVLINSQSSNPSARVIYTLLDQKKNSICEIDFKIISLQKGMNRLNYAQGQINWANSPYRDMLLRDQLISGNFQLCVAVTDVTEVIPNVNDCFEIELKSEDIDNPLGVKPIELQSPYNKDTIEEQRPMLTWIPPSPAYLGTQYYLILTEKKENQTCVESINNNIPLIDKKGIQANLLNYPSESQPLLKGHKYCWRVAAYTNDKEYTRSEEWEFSVREEKKKMTSLPNIEELISNHIIPSNGDFSFVVNNREGIKTIDLKILYLESITNEIKITYPIVYGDNIITIEKKHIDKLGLYKIKVDGLNNKTYLWQLNVK